MPIITGQSGPYPSNLPSYYGGNLSTNILQQQRSQAGVNNLQYAAIQYSPSTNYQQGQISNAAMDDLFFLAVNDIAQFKQQNGEKFTANSVLTRDDVRKSFGAGTLRTPEENQAAAQKADKYYDIVNQDGEEGLSARDLVAEEVLEDAPAKAFKGTRYETLDQGYQNAFRDYYAQKYPNEAMADPNEDVNGIANPASRRLISDMIQSDSVGQNAAVAGALSKLQQQLNLPQSEANFQNRFQTAYNQMPPQQKQSIQAGLANIPNTP
jgi:hypothetical protein